MFIRFVGAEIDERSQVAAGLFCAASQLRWSDDLPDYEFDALTELKDWFNVHMDSPFDHLPRDRRYEQAICWFKPTAREHLERINRTNSATAFAGRGTISDALAERDVLALQRAAYADLAQTAAITQGRFTRSEVKYISTINVTEIQRQADELAKNYRDLDARIQELNWQTELVE